MLRHRYMKNTGSLRRITFGILFWSMANGIYAQTTPGMQPEWLSYDVIYQLGFLWKRAATATLQLTEYPDKYTSVLKARTLPFADNIFKVRDTLVSDMQRNKELLPIYYAKLADENGTYRKDEVNYTYDGNSTTGNIRLYRPKRNAIEDYTLTEPGIVYDMLSIFYVIRTFALPSNGNVSNL